MPQAGAPPGYFMQTVGSMAPMAGARDYRPAYGYEGLPFAGSGGMTGMLMQLLGPMIMQQIQGSTGMMPMGLHGQNVADAITDQRFTRLHDDLIRQSTETDKRTMMEAMRGLAATAGTPWDASTRQSARALSDTMGVIWPMLVQSMPELADQMLGSRGSAAVLASRLHQGGRYRLDPVTGRMGMSTDTVREIEQTLTESAGRGPFRGVSAGQMGLLFDEMQMRGMVRADDRTMRERVAGTGLVDRELLDGVEPGELAKDPDIQQRMRAIDATRIRDQLKAYTGAVSAIRDIFGDMGQPNAPMKQLLSGLEAMTGGNLAQIDPGRLEMMVRNTYNLAQQTGTGIDQAMQMQHYGANLANQLGIEPAIAIGATQGALAYGGAYRARGLNAPQLASWGRMNAAEAQQMDLNLRMRAGASRQANRMAAALRASETLGGLEGAAGRYVSAIRAGETEFEIEPGRFTSVDISRQQYIAMFRQAGIHEDTMNQMLADDFTNREFVEKHGLSNLVRRLQPAEMGEFVQRQLQGSIYQRVYNQLLNNGMDPDEADAKASAIALKSAGKVSQAMQNASPETFTNRGLRNTLISNALRESFEGTAAETFSQEFRLITAEQAYGEIESGIRQRYPGLKGAQAAFQMMDPVTLRYARRQMQRAQFTSERQRILSGLGQGTVLRRIMGRVMQAEGTDIPEIVGEAFGMFKEADLREVFRGEVEAAGTLSQQIQKVEEQIQATDDPERRAALTEERDRLMRQFDDTITGIADEARERGVFMGGAYSVGDIEKATASMDQLAAFTAKIPRFKTRAEADEFWRSNTGRDYRQAVSAAMTNTEDMLIGVAESPEILGRLGKGAKKKLLAARNASDKLKQLAATYTGGDIAALVSGDFSASNKAEIMDQVRSAGVTIRSFGGDVESAMGETKKLTEDELTKAKERSAELKDELGILGSPQELLERMGRAYMGEDADTSQLEAGVARNRAFARIAVRTRESLADYAESIGIEGTAAERARTLFEKFRGGTDRETMQNIMEADLPAEVREALTFQFRTGLGSVGAKGGQLREILSRGEAAGSEAYGQIDQGDAERDPQGRRMEVHITGTLDRQGNLEGHGYTRGDVPAKA